MRVMHAVVAHQLAAQVIGIVDLAYQPLRSAFARVHHLDLPGARCLAWRQRDDQRIACMFLDFAAHQIVIQVQARLVIGTGLRLAAAQLADFGHGERTHLVWCRAGFDTHQQERFVAYQLGQLLLHGGVLLRVQAHGHGIHAHLPPAAAILAGQGQHIAAALAGLGLDGTDHLPLFDLGMGQRRPQQHGE
ncbi:hypothetical protein D3C72_1257500 [compost metagenome]